MQLVAYGAQDVYLTANPQVTFFKQIYRRHSNFAMESLEQAFSGVANFGKRVECNITRSGDLAHRMVLEVTLPSVDLNDPSVSDSSGDQFRWLNWVGHNIINSIEIQVGANKIDRHYGEWLHIWNELTCPPGKQAGYADMVGNVPELTNLISRDVGEDGGCTNQLLGGDPHSSSETRSCTPEYTLYIPLQFWFNRHPGLSLPLIALQYHDVRVIVEFNQLQNLVWTNNPSVLDAVNATGLIGASLFVDYIYLDTEERRKFAQVPHEYLIEQIQFTGAESITSASNKIKMNFNHPCKEIIWVIQRDSFVACDSSVDPWKGQQPFNYSDYWDRAALESGYSISMVEGLAGWNPTVTANMMLNGADRMPQRQGRYFNVVQPYFHHTNTPAVGINTYSFALFPEDIQPSGTCNFSRIDTAYLNFTASVNTVGGGNTAKVRIYARNYNVFRAMAGMGGLAYAN